MSDHDWGEIPIPAPIYGQEKAKEFCRLWHDEKGQLVVVLRVGIYEDPAHWGRTLASIARQVAHGCAERGIVRILDDGQEREVSESDVFSRVLVGFAREVENPRGHHFDWEPDA